MTTTDPLDVPSLAPPGSASSSGLSSAPSGSRSPSPSIPRKRSISEVSHDASNTTSTTTPAKAGPSAAIAQDAKRKKSALTPAEKKEKEAKKEEEKKKKAEEKVKKDEEKKRKAEEKKRKADEKEAEKKKKEEEKARKKRAQPTLNKFLLKTPTPAPKSQPAAAAPDVKKEEEKAEPIATIPPAEKSDYEEAFFPFFVKANTTLAPTIPFAKDAEQRAAAQAALDEAMRLPPDGIKREGNDDAEVPGVKGMTRNELVELVNLPPHKLRKRGYIPLNTRELLARINAPDDPSLPALCHGIKPEAYTSSYYIELLSHLPHKYLKFAEDVRPPYIGTYTRKPSSSALLRGRNPFKRDLPRVEYDYDSEAEWVADEEGEELMSEAESNAATESDDLDDFLDDEEDMNLRRRGGIALVASCSGLCWEDRKGRNERKDLEGMRIGLLLENIAAPIDPFSPRYWDTPHPTAVTHTPAAPAAMKPPPRPSPTATRTAAPEKKKPTVPPALLPVFKAEIDGSDMTKTGLIEILKKKFPAVSKEAIRNTLEEVADRVGRTNVEKRWVLK